MLEVTQRRGGRIETVHPVAWAVVDASGRVLGDGVELETPWRSAAKPFQLVASLAVLGDPECTPEELAVGAASHGAEPAQVAIVEALLARFGGSVAGLRCGAHPPMHAPSAAALLRRGEAPTALHSNCSGKHAFMLGATLRAGWPPDYRPAEHPLQERIAATVATATGERPARSVDGCGVPTFHLTVGGIARAWASMALAMRDPGRDPGLARIGDAMARHPELTSGSDRFDRQVVGAARERLAVKIGAQGVFCLALPERGLGVALKVRSGVQEALGAAVAAVLERVAPGAWAPPAGWPALEVLNVVGDRVGDWRATGI